MGVNDLNLRIKKEICGGDGGKEHECSRKLFEVLFLERSGVIINAAQESKIEEYIAEFEIVNNKICDLIGEIPLKDITE